MLGPGKALRIRWNSQFGCAFVDGSHMQVDDCERDMKKGKSSIHLHSFPSGMYSTVKCSMLTFSVGDLYMMYTD